MTQTTILGIVPGTATLGWGVIRQEGTRPRYAQHGAITSPPDWPIPRRLSRLYDGLSRLLEGYEPDALAVEGLYFETNVTTAITAGQAHARLCLGVVLLAAYRAGVPATGYTSLQVKRTVTSYDRAEKHQVQETVKVLLGLPAIPRPGAVAAGLATAITHAFSSRPRRPLLRRVK